MPMFQVAPVFVEAVQFDGENWAEMHEFTGHRDREDDDHPIDVFSPDPNSDIPMLWVAAKNSWVPVEVGFWIVQGPSGFTPWDPRIFVMSFVEVQDTPEVLEWNSEEPTEPGFYYNRGSAQVMLYLLDHQKQWWAIVDNSMMEKCVWGYIEQMIETYPLRRVGT